MKKAKLLPAIAVLAAAFVLLLILALQIRQDLLLKNEYSAQNGDYFTCYSYDPDGHRLEGYHSKKDDVWYLFLTSVQSVEDATLYASGGVTQTSRGKLDEKNGVIRGAFTQNGDQVVLTTADGTNHTVVALQSDLPSVYIDLEGTTLEQIHSDRTVKYDSTSVFITDPAGEHALSVRNDDPQGASRPFSKSRDGFVMAEGAATLILEEYEHAVARGAKIYAEIVGTGLTADAYHITAPHPDGEGAYRVMKAALDEAGLQTTDVDYINVHGTSTYAGDIAEAKAIRNLFGEHAYNLNISSTKSVTGHLLGAAGAIEALLTVLAIKNDVIPPTINHADGDEDPEIDYRMNFTFNKAQERKVKVALSNTFGFGGHNASIAFKKIED